MAEEFERELAEDWESAKSDLDEWEEEQIFQDHEGEIEIGIADGFDFED